MSQKVYGKTNLGISFEGGHDLVQADAAAIPMILQLHGAFTWKFGVPIKVAALKADTEYTGETLWIPPAILKESKSYPFNKINGLAHELLLHDCDILRVVGSSLTQNDWNVIAMIFNAQRIARLTRGTSFLIELIMPSKACDDIRNSCTYLKSIKTIGDISDGDFAPYKEEKPPYADPDMNNPLLYWLKEKFTYHRSKGHFGEGPLPPAISAVLGDAS